MVSFSLTHWPLVVVCSGMVVAAVIDGWKFKVPNRLTFPLILGGWLLGAGHDLGGMAGSGTGGFLDALAGTALGFALLVPMYAIGGMGAGDVKMQMAFGSWIGAYYGMAAGATVIVHAFCAGAIVGGVLAVAMIVARWQLRVNLLHGSAILRDLFSSGSLASIAAKARERRPRWHRLPYGIPLCIGFLGYLWWVGI